MKIYTIVKTFRPTFSEKNILSTISPKNALDAMREPVEGAFCRLEIYETGRRYALSEEKAIKFLADELEATAAARTTASVKSTMREETFLSPRERVQAALLAVGLVASEHKTTRDLADAVSGLLNPEKTS